MSEDGIYNLMGDYYDATVQMLELSKQNLSKIIKNIENLKLLCYHSRNNYKKEY